MYFHTNSVPQTAQETCSTKSNQYLGVSDISADSGVGSLNQDRDVTGLSSQMHDITAMARESAGSAELLLSRHYISNPTCPQDAKASRPPTIPETSSDTKENLRLTCSRLMQLISVVQN